MSEGLIFILSFFGGMFCSLIIYGLLCVLVGEEDKLIVFKTKKLTKKERIEKLEDFTKEVDYQIRYIKSRIIDIASNYQRKEDKK